MADEHEVPMPCGARLLMAQDDCPDLILTCQRPTGHDERHAAMMYGGIVYWIGTPPDAIAVSGPIGVVYRGEIISGR